VNGSSLVRFSRRLTWGAQENALASAEAERRASGLPLFDLTLSNPTLAELPYPAQAIAHAIADPANPLTARGAGVHKRREWELELQLCGDGGYAHPSR